MPATDPEHRETVGAIAAFFRDLTTQWVAWMSGLGGLFLQVVGFWRGDDGGGQLFFALGALALVLAAFLAYRELWQKWRTVEAALVPALDVRIGPHQPPTVGLTSPTTGTSITTLRIAIRNESAKPIFGAKAILVDVDPPKGHIYPSHTLRQMGVAASSTFDLLPYGEVWIDVLDESVCSPSHGAHSLAICYSQTSLPAQIAPQRPYKITLRFEGGARPLTCIVEYDASPNPRVWRVAKKSHSALRT